MIAQLAVNWLCWAILLLAIFCYQQLWQQFFYLKTGTDFQQVAVNQQFCSILIAALPLLGLLGTIIGLLDSFAGIAQQGASGALLSGGIGDALLTTQLGLVCALPAWILQGGIRAKVARQLAFAVTR
jgi:biopolymer transport protein ExbB